MARGGTFGLSSNSNRRGRGGYRGGSRHNVTFRGRGRGAASGYAPADGVPQREDDGSQLAERFEQVRLSDDIDEKLGFSRVQEGPRREGWLINMCPTLVKDPDYPAGRAAVNFYFVTNDEEYFKCTMQYEPYFLIACKVGSSFSLVCSHLDICRVAQNHRWRNG